MGVAAVTGGTGFVGSHLVRLLCERGDKVRALARPTSRLDVLNGLPVDMVYGDLRDPNSLLPLVDGVSVLYHVAADYRLWSPNSSDLYESNVDGTTNILSAAAAAGVTKVVYTSTVGCLGIPKDGNPGDETTSVEFADMVGHYKKSKYIAEQVALQFARNGMPLVIVNPSTPIGPGDHKPTPTGKIIVDFLNGKIPAYVDTGLNLIDVRDTAIGHILAAEKGRIGEKYILGARNLTLKQILEIVALMYGKHAPKVKIPYKFAYFVGFVSTAWSHVTHCPPGIALESVKMARKKMFFSSEKAVHELGLPQSPVENSIADAVHWFIDHGYASSGKTK
jgi:dihydroflavonol-4-reductase